MASLHGSLAFTGIGHGSGRAVILGLCGQNPRGIDPDNMDAMVAEVEATGMVHPPGHPPYRFRPAVDLVFDKTHPLPGHPNALQFTALDTDGQLLLRRVYYSIGGGFVVTEAETGGAQARLPGPGRCALSLCPCQGHAGDGGAIGPLHRRDETRQ